MSEITTYWLCRYSDENNNRFNGGVVRKATRKEYECYLAAVAAEGGDEDATIWMAESGRFDWKAHCRKLGWPIDIDCISSERWNTREHVVKDWLTPEHSRTMSGPPNNFRSALK